MNFQKEYDRDLKCIDCKYSKADFMNRLLKLSAGFTCRLPESFTEERYDPVTGKVTPGYFQYCSSMRLDSMCGPKAKRWVPRNTKLVFLALKKETNG